MSVPPSVVKLAEDIQNRKDKYSDVVNSPYTSESFNRKDGAGQIGEALSNAASDIDEFFNVSAVGEGWNDFRQGVGEFTENRSLGMDFIVQGISNFKSNREEGKQIIGDKIADLKQDWTAFKDNRGLGVTTFKDNPAGGQKSHSGER